MGREEGRGRLRWTDGSWNTRRDRRHSSSGLVPYIYVYIYIYLFERQRGRDLPFPRVWARPKPGVRSLFAVSHLGARAGLLSFLCAFPGCQQGAESEAEQPGLDSFTRWVTTPVPGLLLEQALSALAWGLEAPVVHRVLAVLPPQCPSAPALPRKGQALMQGIWPLCD